MLEQATSKSTPRSRPLTAESPRKRFKNDPELKNCYTSISSTRIHKIFKDDPYCNLQNLLPKEIISHILFGGFFESTSKQLHIICSVCQQFNKLAKSFWRILDARKNFVRSAPKLNARKLSNMIDQYQYLRDVDFSHLGNTFTDRHLQLLTPIRENLHSLKLRGTVVSERGIINFFKSSRIMNPFPLRKLDLSKVFTCEKNNIGNAGMSAVAHTCPNLQSLLISCTKINDAFVEALPIFMKKLHTLDVSMCSISSRGCSHLALLPLLSTVDVSSIPGLNGIAIRALVTGKLLSDNGVIQKDSLEESHTLEREGSNINISSHRESSSNLTTIIAQCATSGVNQYLFETLLCQAPFLKTLDLRFYRGEDLSTEYLSHMKISLRKLSRKGVKVALSRRS